MATLSPNQAPVSPEAAYSQYPRIMPQGMRKPPMPQPQGQAQAGVAPVVPAPNQTPRRPEAMPQQMQGPGQRVGNPQAQQAAYQRAMTRYQ